MSESSSSTEPQLNIDTSSTEHSTSNATTSSESPSSTEQPSSLELDDPPSYEVDSPPSYETASEESNLRNSTVARVKLQQRAPGKIICKGLISAGSKTIAQHADFVTIPRTATYVDIQTLLHARFLSRTGTLAPTKELAFYCRVALWWEGERTLLDEGNWATAKTILEMHEGNVELAFLFALVPRDYAAETAASRRFRRVTWWRERDEVCLVEPNLVLLEETTAEV